VGRDGPGTLGDVELQVVIERVETVVEVHGGRMSLLSLLGREGKRRNSAGCPEFFGYSQSTHTKLPLRNWFGGFMSPQEPWHRRVGVGPGSQLQR